MKFLQNIRIFKKMNKAFVSPMDRFLQTFNASHQLTASQTKEAKIHEAIAAKRDHSQPAPSKSKVQWPQD